MKKLLTISFLVCAVLFITACEPNFPNVNVDSVVEDVLKEEINLIDKVLNKEFKATSSPIAIDDNPVFSFIIIKDENERYKLTSKEGTAFITVKDNKYFIDSEELIIEADNNRILIGNKVYEGT